MFQQREAPLEFGRWALRKKQRRFDNRPRIAAMKTSSLRVEF